MKGKKNNGIELGEMTKFSETIDLWPSAIALSDPGAMSSEFAGP